MIFHSSDLRTTCQKAVHLAFEGGRELRGKAHSIIIGSKSASESLFADVVGLRLAVGTEADASAGTNASGVRFAWIAEESSGVARSRDVLAETIRINQGNSQFLVGRGTRKKLDKFGAKCF
jgi:hypothetical protein